LLTPAGAHVSLSRSDATWYLVEGQKVMSSDDLQHIERAIGWSLSPAVRGFFLNNPAALRSTTRDLGPTPEGEPYLECPADNELSDRADAIIALNAPQAVLMFDDSGRRLVVGEGACGEVYWVDLDDPSGPVYRIEAGADPEDSDRLADSLEQFAQGLIESYRAS
jgi:hypothetical protein